MITYILKSSISLVVLFGLYWFLLRREKLFIFNRVFLIFSILFSLSVPFISIPVTIERNEIQGNIITTLNNAIPYYNQEPNAIIDSETESVYNSQPLAVKTTQRISYTQILILLYIAGVLVLLVRFLRNIYYIYRQINKSEIISYSGQRLVLTSSQINPFCFFDTIFVSSDDYRNNAIAEELLTHEIEHIRQSHSLDVIFIELIKIIYWFNPVLNLYSRAIRVNHEYLADNGVISRSTDIKDYADKLLNYISCKRNVPLTSGFNPSLTRKRLIMLTKSKSGMMNYSTRIFATICLAAFLTLALGFTPVYPQPAVNDLNTKVIPGKNSDAVFETLLIDKDSSVIKKNNLNLTPQSFRLIDNNVRYIASGYIKQDSIKQIYILKGDAIVSFGEITIKADSIVFNKGTNQVFASGRKNSSGTIIGKPVFKEGSAEFVADEITYNLKTRKALIKNVNAQVNVRPEDSVSFRSDISETKQEKEIVSAAGVVAVTKMNVLYLGVPNPIEIAVPGVTSDRVTATTTNGTIARTKNGWAVFPSSPDDLVLNIYVDNKKVNEKTFRIKLIPAPVAVFAGKNNGSISRDVIKTAALEAELKDFLWELKFEIDSFTFFYSKDGYDNEITSKGNMLTDEMRSIISDLKSGQMIVFKEIKAKGPDNKIYDLSPIILKID